MPPRAPLLPRFVVARLDALARELSTPADLPALDFSTPAGEPALAAADSVSWRVFRNPVSLFVGGVTAVLLELAEPRVRTGVWEHTSFRTDPMPRLQRTGLAAMITVYGARSRAEAMIAGVRRMHGQVAGTTPQGAAYRADQPELLDWVQATASYGFLQAYHRWVRPLSDAEQDQLYAEAAPAAALYGATGAPTSCVGLEALFATMRPSLERSPIISEFLAIMARTEILPGPSRLMQGALIRAAVSTLPDWAIERLDLHGQRLRPWEPALVRLAGRTADRLVLPSSPPVQACRRLGLPDDWLAPR
jgi:uncharacterized protein (DUF2236 family)